MLPSLLLAASVAFGQAPPGMPPDPIQATPQKSGTAREVEKYGRKALKQGDPLLALAQFQAARCHQGSEPTCADAWSDAVDRVATDALRRITDAKEEAPFWTRLGELNRLHGDARSWKASPEVIASIQDERIDLVRQRVAAARAQWEGGEQADGLELLEGMYPIARDVGLPAAEQAELDGLLVEITEKTLASGELLAVRPLEPLLAELPADHPVRAAVQGHFQSAKPQTDAASPGLAYFNQQLVRRYHPAAAVPATPSTVLAPRYTGAGCPALQVPPAPEGPDLVEVAATFTTCTVKSEPSPQGGDPFLTATVAGTTQLRHDGIEVDGQPFSVQLFDAGRSPHLAVFGDAGAVDTDREASLHADVWKQIFAQQSLPIQEIEGALGSRLAAQAAQASGDEALDLYIRAWLLAPHVNHVYAIADLLGGVDSFFLHAVLTGRPLQTSRRPTPIAPQGFFQIPPAQMRVEPPRSSQRSVQSGPNHVHAQMGSWVDLGTGVHIFSESAPMGEVWTRLRWMPEREEYREIPLPDRRQQENNTIYARGSLFHALGAANSSEPLGFSGRLGIQVSEREDDGSIGGGFLIEYEQFRRTDPGQWQRGLYGGLTVETSINPWIGIHFSYRQNLLGLPDLFFPNRVEDTHWSPLGLGASAALGPVAIRATGSWLAIRHGNALNIDASLSF